MEKQQMAKWSIRAGAALALAAGLVTTSMAAANHGNWEAWGDVTFGNTAQCGYGAYSVRANNNPRILIAITNTIRSVQARSWPSATVTVHYDENANGNTAQTTAPGNITWHQCRRAIPLI